MVLKYYGCKFESQLAAHKKKAVYTGGAGLLCECTGKCALEGSVQK